jgi:hypothetical protein
MVIQLVLIGLWFGVLIVHIQRLLRLACVVTSSPLQDQCLRRRLQRVWWWLGREEYWWAVQDDALRCVQVTLMVMLLVSGM